MENLRGQFTPTMFPKLKVESYKVDEGYSEDNRSQDDMDSPTGLEQDGRLLEAHMLSVDELSTAASALSEAERAELAYDVLRSLRVSSISEVVDRLWPLFHKDPISIFPSEIMSQIFSYLTPKMLLEASRASRAWRERILDNGLWKRKFNTEGWDLDAEEIQSFERDYNRASVIDPFVKASERGKGKQRESIGDFGKKIGDGSHTEQTQGTPTSYRMPARASLRSTKNSHHNNNPQISCQEDKVDDHEMPDVNIISSIPKGENDDSSIGNQRLRDFRRVRQAQPENEAVVGASSPHQALSPQQTNHQGKITCTPLMWGTPGYARVNYHHIFKQKRKLEHNWDTGQYTSFQLPHRDHPEDAHTECVYTIQYSGKHLVSGSRDRTLRIWSLDTQRLIREPLQGHSGSVLCLQFDDQEDEDLIVSGSSDESVILWQFSTGRMIKRLKGAHRESVLNLKFDKRFLVTCSKDKTIKIWNRHQLRPSHRDYPVKGVTGGGQCPDYIIDMNDIGVALREPYLFPNKSLLLEPYTHLMTLELHGAAVNAIQIFKDELVSASGDRNIRVWNIHTGESSTKMEAHTKGIACVQYDGMRIVSGSSDRTIRIWDPISKTEVARLDGHTNLVRTIQAAFADYPGGRKNLEREALEVERNFQAASMAGLIDPESGRRSRGTPGSRKPKDFKSVGAKIPPSGGGGKWGRIVSGSYDETIIIWKKTEDDEWVIGHRLRQEEALRAAGPPLIPRSDAQAHAHATLNLANHVVNNQQATLPGPAHVQGQAVGAQGPSSTFQNPIGPHGVRVDALASPPGPSTSPQPASGDSTHPSSFPLLPNSPNSQALARAYQQLMQGQQPGVQATLPNQPQIANNVQNTVPMGQQQRPRPPPPRPLPAGQGHQAQQGGQPNARVFKLQFDARRIICCSQDPKIVGWDFANGDSEIMGCSRFFAAPQ